MNGSNVLKASCSFVKERYRGVESEAVAYAIIRIVVNQKLYRKETHKRAMCLTETVGYATANQRGLRFKSQAGRRLLTRRCFREKSR